ncbi:MAG: hypothetical protein RSE62_03400 [Citrobacter sp.]
MKRTIETEYFGMKGESLKKCYALHSRRAVLHAVNAMQMNLYAASVAVITDTEYGELHAIIKHTVVGDIIIAFKRDPRSPVCLRLERDLIV